MKYYKYPFKLVVYLGFSQETNEAYPLQIEDRLFHVKYTITKLTE